MTTSRTTVLHVEDDPNDRLFVERAFKKCGVAVDVQAVPSGEEAVRYLSAEGPFADRGRFPQPAFVLLDLKLTGMTGFETLEWARKQADSRLLPIAVLTSSRELSDVRRAYEAGATTYFVKPNDSEDLRAMIKTLAGYWFVFAKLPEEVTEGS
ncbi:MAG TPA: response regulator [Planctomycetota bacterium]|nr:response regulator [Planctomycetota bacterium]